MNEWTGKGLYELYLHSHAADGTGIDEFEDLHPNERKAWEHVANEINRGVQPR